MRSRDDSLHPYFLFIAADLRSEEGDLSMEIDMCAAFTRPSQCVPANDSLSAADDAEPKIGNHADMPNVQSTRPKISTQLEQPFSYSTSICPSPRSSAYVCCHGEPGLQDAARDASGSRATT